MKGIEALDFGVEVEGLLINKSGLVEKTAPIDFSSVANKDVELNLHFSQLTAEVEVKNSHKQRDINHGLAEIRKKIKDVKQVAQSKQRTAVFDSRIQEDKFEGTIGTHVHIDLTGFSLLRGHPNFISHLGSEFMRYWFKILADRYCYSERLKTRVNFTLSRINFKDEVYEDQALAECILIHDLAADPVKIIKNRPKKGSFEICIPDSFDFRVEEDVFINLVTDCRTAVLDCVRRFENGETILMGDQELEDVLSSYV
jgi:phage gp46-like protein